MLRRYALTDGPGPVVQCGALDHGARVCDRLTVPERRLTGERASLCLGRGQFDRTASVSSSRATTAG